MKKNTSFFYTYVILSKFLSEIKKKKEKKFSLSIKLILKSSGYSFYNAYVEHEVNFVIITTVADGFQEDYGKSIGRIPKNCFKNLNLEIGEIVEVISGNRRVGVFLRPIEEITKESIPQRMLYSKPKKSSIKKEGFYQK